METPKSIEHHQVDYKEGIWQQYSLLELGSWVHLFCKRAYHRIKREKIEKDLHDAQAYLDMMQAHIDEAKESLMS